MTEPAKADLDGIYDYIAEDSPETAARFIERFVGHLHRLARTGVTGVGRDGLRAGLRMHPYEKYCVYFRLNDLDFIVVRIIHSARDFDAVKFLPEV